jgi:surfeit locus 1 family protein
VKFIVNVEGPEAYSSALRPAGPRARTVMGGTVAGHILVTPLHSKRWGKAVLVNRGWVPVEWRSDAAMRSAGQPSGQVRRTCV